MVAVIETKKVDDTSAKRLVSCLDCVHHQVISDRDPVDRFNDDDKAVVCTLSKNTKQKDDSIWEADRQPFKVVACSVRPYRLELEASLPDWCPCGHKPMVQFYTLAKDEESIDTNIRFNTMMETKKEARPDLRTFICRWDGKDPKSLSVIR